MIPFSFNSTTCIAGFSYFFILLPHDGVHDGVDLCLGLTRADGIVAAVLISNGNRSRTHIRIVAVAHGVLLGRDHRLAVLHGHRRSLCRAVVEVIGLLQRDGRSADSLCRDGERCGAADGIVAVGPMVEAGTANEAFVEG